MLREMFNCVKIGPGIALRDISQKSGCDSYHKSKSSYVLWFLWYSHYDSVTVLWYNYDTITVSLRNYKFNALMCNIFVNCIYKFK